MLVLTRNCGQSVIFGNHLITIKVLEVNGQNVRLGIDAPADLSVHRDEIFERIKKEPDYKPKVKRTISNIYINGEKNGNK